MKVFYNPPDVTDAYDEWKATCGPMALAAVLHRPVMSVRPFFPGFPARPYVNPTMMQSALSAARADSRKQLSGWPYYGLLFLQVEGPWCNPGCPVAAAYRHTHWVGYASPEAVRPNAPSLTEPQVFDGNAGIWLPKSEWESEVMSEIVRHHGGRATGWSLRTAFAVKLA